jgi:hypothetical protein
MLCNNLEAACLYTVIFKRCLSILPKAHPLQLAQDTPQLTCTHICAFRRPLQLAQYTPQLTCTHNCAFRRPLQSPTFQQSLLIVSPFHIHTLPRSTFLHSVLRIQVLWDKTWLPSASVCRRSSETTANTKQLSQRPFPATLNRQTTAVVTSELSACPMNDTSLRYWQKSFGERISAFRCANFGFSVCKVRLFGEKKSL